MFAIGRCLLIGLLILIVPACKSPKPPEEPKKEDGKKGEEPKDEKAEKAPAPKEKKEKFVEGYCVARIDLDEVKRHREERLTLQARQPTVYRNIVRKY